ncbi:NucA/NucB deoxyribonuclease domain-containing protein [Streptomyces sp. NPDC057638]|uniref:NucA/NucB deoxyribonuclease domain-containing protein n=1 Tax=Streptomyces sp. NPDC057638 TaxID=3346190 RepID=UPI0036C05D6B
MDLRTECAKHEAAAKTVKGWLKNRFESCQKRPYDLVIRNKNGTETIGRLWFDQWVLGFAYDGSRRVDYVSSIENIRVQTVGNEDATKWRIGQSYRKAVHTSSSDPNPKITEPPTIKREELLGVWETAPHWDLTYTSPDKGPQHATGNQQRVAGMIHLDLFVDSPNATSYSQVDAHRSRIRFDYAGSVAGKHKGTVFPDARVELVMSRKDPAVNESALHIYDALERPERTFPSFLGKLIPGEKDPLHRLIDPKKQDSNRDKSIKMCKEIWGDYSGTRLQCDEYPFASTHEGSAKGDNKYSVRLIDKTDNEEGGRMLNSMYTLNRVLDGDPFYLKITS